MQSNGPQAKYIYIYFFFFSYLFHYIYCTNVYLDRLCMHTVTAKQAPHLNGLLPHLHTTNIPSNKKGSRINLYGSWGLS